MRQILTMDEMRGKASSIFAVAGAGYVSEHYKHIGTGQVIEGLIKEGFMPTLATQQRTRTPERIGFQKHMIRFTHQNNLENKVGEYHPEIVLVNSHDRSSAYHLYFGIFRLVCENGMVVCSTDLGSLTVRHQGTVVNNVIEASYRLIGEAPAVQAKIEAFKALDMSEPMKEEFARKAAILKWGEPKVEPSQLLQARRFGDEKNDLWTVFNTLQENLFKGGMGYTITSRNRRSNRTSRAIKGIDETITLNQHLWVLAESYLKEAVA